MSGRVIGKPKSDSIHEPLSSTPSRLRPTPSHSLPSSPNPSNAGPSAITTTGSWEGMVCPICQITTNNLMDLNKHLDQEHAEEDIPQVIFNWFKQAPKKLLTPLSNSLKNTNNFQKLQRLTTGSPTIHQMDQFMESSESQSKISQAHWEKGYEGMECCQIGCTKSLGLLNGKINCRKCGKLFCDQHVNHQAKLNTNAEYDPEAGEYFKVCLNCFKNRPHYNETEGVTRSWTEKLAKLRKQEVDKVHLEVNRLEKRLEKLAKVHGSQRSSTYLFNSLPKISNNFRETEKMIVEWEDDEKVSNCPYCYKKFGITNRRHHCRVCGKIVCGQNICSAKLNLNNLWLFEGDKNNNPQIEVIVCRDCNDKIHKRNEIKKQDSSIPPVAKLYPTLKRHKEVILKTLPMFNELVFSLRNNAALIEASGDYQRTVKLRRDLMESFTSFDSINKKIRDLAFNSHSQKVINKSIYSAGHMFLQTYMLSLSLLPKPSQPEQKPPLPVRRIADDANSTKSDSGSTKSNANGSETIELNFEAIEHRNQLNVFREQIDQLRLLQQEATKHRKLEDYQSLELSIQELNAEIDIIKDKLRNLGP